MNDLILRDDFQKSCPTVVEGLKRAQSIFDSIKSFEDIERVFLKGAGLSPHTYRSYLQSIKQLYEYTDHRNPLQIIPADIEAFYDDLMKRVDRNTARLRIAGIKKFFAGIRTVIPIYTSPFELMTEKLQKKINGTKKGNRTKKALTTTEVKDLLAWLEKDQTVRGLEDHAIIYMLFTSGLRADELVQLKWKDIDMVDGSFTASFIGKGGKDAEQELYPAAVNACIRYYNKAFRRDPRPDDALFWTLPRFEGDPPRPISYWTLWDRVKKAGAAAREAGIIKRNVSFSPHLFRRSYATCLYKSGMKLKAIQEKTRHANIEVLTKHYIDDNEPATPYLEKILI